MDTTQRVRAYLSRFHAEDRVIEFSVSSATVALAAAALGCEEGRIAKTLSFMAGDQPLFVVAAGDRRVDNHKFKERFHAKAKMMTAQQLEALTGLHFGGVCPFGIPEAVQIWLDASLRAWDVVYPAAGTESSAVRLNLAELEQFSGALGWVDVCKGPDAPSDTCP